MVAPSGNVQFTEGDSFRKKATPVPGLGYAITEFLQNWPNLGELICKDIRKVEVVNGGRNYAVVFTRRIHQVGLMNIFEVPGDGKIPEDYLKKIREIYYGGRP